MTKLLCTIWALVLNVMGISIFRTCFANAIEDEDGYPLEIGSPVTKFFFSSGVYTFIVNSILFPNNFRKPKAYLLCIYEFLATAFFLEFAMACIWAPIGIMIVTNIPKFLCDVLVRLNMSEAAEALMATKTSMIVLTCVLTFGFFLLALHTTKSVDFTILMECGWSFFLDYTVDRLWLRICNELPKTKRKKTTRKRGKSQRRGSCCCE